MIHLNFDPDIATTDKQFRLLSRAGCRSLNPYSQSGFQFCGNFPQAVFNRSKSLSSVGPLRIDIDQININRKTRHIATEKVDRRPPFHRKTSLFEDERSYIEQQCNRISVLPIHADSSAPELWLLKGYSQSVNRNRLKTCRASLIPAAKVLAQPARRVASL